MMKQYHNLWCQSIVKTIDSDLEINADNEIEVSYVISWNIHTYFVYLKSNKDLSYNRLIDPNILDLRIYQILFFLLDVRNDIFPSKHKAFKQMVI